MVWNDGAVIMDIDLSQERSNIVTEKRSSSGSAILVVKPKSP